MTDEERQKSLEDLDARLKKARGAASPSDQDPGTVRSMSSGPIAMAMRVGTEMVAALVAGLLLGLLLDRWLGTSPWFLFVFLLLGLVAGLRSAYRTSQRVTQMAIEAEEEKDSTKAPD